MKRIIAVMMAVITALSACGCQSSGEPEHEAYAISLSLDGGEGKLLTVGVQVPSLGAGDSSGDSSGKSSYQTYTATGETFPQTIDLLMATIPARLVLAHLKSIVVSEALARSADFGILVSDMIATYQLYGSSVLIVCKDKAIDFIKAQKPAIGKRFSTAFTATIQHYGDMGYVVMTTLYEAYAAMHSIYSDPVLAYASKAEENKNSGQSGQSGQSGKSGETSLYGMGEQSPFAGVVPGNGLAGSLARTGPDENEFMGCAVTRKGSVAGTLTGSETALLSLITGKIDSMSYYIEGVAMRLKPDKMTRLYVDCAADEPIISVETGVLASSISDLTDLSAVKEALENDIAGLIEKVQRMGCEIFGFSERAARGFATIDGFLEYGFREKFSRANVGVTVAVRGEEGE